MLSNSIVVPFIDKTFLDISHARKILKTTDPTLLTEIMPVDIANIVAKKGLDIKTTRISEDKSIHGMIVCEKGDINIWDDDRKCYNIEFCKGKTIFIDQLLTNQNVINRYRFTLAHEFAHWVLHKKIINKIAKEKKILPFLSCTERDINNEIIEKAEARCEWQANYLAGALLMPYLPLKKYFYNYSDIKFSTEETQLKIIEFLASAYMVSVKAMYIRLRQLGYIESMSILNSKISSAN